MASATALIQAAHSSIATVGDVLSATARIDVRAVTTLFYYTAGAIPTQSAPAACKGPTRFNFGRLHGFNASSPALSSLVKSLEGLDRLHQSV